MSEPGNEQTTRAVVKALLDDGQTLAAYDKVAIALKDAPKDRALRELKARALSGLGARLAAVKLLVTLCREDRDAKRKGPQTEEALGLLASALKRANHPRWALAFYRKAYKQSNGYWTGINVATLCATMGLDKDARRVAKQVAKQARIELGRTADPEDRIWVHGTLGEAALLLGEIETALGHYREVRHLVEDLGKWEQLRSVRGNAERLFAVRDVDQAPFDDVFTPPPLAVCVGHMVDGKQSARSRFPPSLVGEVEAAIQGVVEKHDVRVGISSMAHGADLLFQKVMAGRKARRHVVLPFGSDRFQELSVSSSGDDRWDVLFNQLLPDDDDRLEASQHEFPWGGLCYDFANGVLYGRALMLAEKMGAEVLRIAVYDGYPGLGPGGTHTVVAHWQRAEGDGPVEIIHPQDLPGWPKDLRVGTPCDDTSPSADSPVAEGDRRVMAVIFADAKGFSGFDEERNLAFVEDFLGSVHDCVEAEYADDVFFVNTWGDGIYFALQDVERAGRLALDLRDVPHTYRRRLRKSGLGGVDLRVAVHAGPVNVVTDPLTAQLRVTGTHLSRAARTEPKTPVGQVYASEPFAALSRAYRPSGDARTSGARGYHCRYVGRVDLAKGFGAFPTYILER